MLNEEYYSNQRLNHLKEERSKLEDDLEPEVLLRVNLLKQKLLNEQMISQEMIKGRKMSSCDKEGIGPVLRAYHFSDIAQHSQFIRAKLKAITMRNRQQ